ncbi:MAG: Fur family transcriptional regulator [Sphingomonadales bacterium]|jgi:Fur family zinc uptake transcriptional regulator
MTSATAHIHEYTPLSDKAVKEALARAKNFAKSQDKSLTPQRASVYRLLLKAGRPVGAYELMAMLGDEAEKQVAPPTVYRALEFLQELNLVSRIESTNEFLPCTHPGEPHDCMFLVCSCCGVALEIDGAPFDHVVEQAAKNVGFVPERRVVEITGRCLDCQSHDHR